MRIALIGMGRMGRMIRDCAADRGIEVAAEFNTATIAQLAQCDRMDAVIDFPLRRRCRHSRPMCSAPERRSFPAPPAIATKKLPASMRWAATRP